MEDAQVQQEWGRSAQLISATISVFGLFLVCIHLGLFSVITELSTLLVFFFLSPLSSRFLPLFHVAVQVICLFCLAPVVGTLVMFFWRAGWFRDRLADLTAILVLLAKAGAAQPAPGKQSCFYGSSPSDLPTASRSRLGPTVLLPPCSAMLSQARRWSPARLLPALPPQPPRMWLQREV